MFGFLRRQRSGPCVSFPVHSVKPGTSPLLTVPAQRAIATLVGTPEACGRPLEPYLVGIKINPLVAAVHTAFSGHRALVLTPDSIWISIAQGVAQHVALDPERWRSVLVPHAGKAKILIARDDLIPRDHENPWGDIAEDFRLQLQKTSCVSDRLTADFTTTGPEERLAQSVVLMDLLAPYYDYNIECICGIPEIALAGKPEDWELLLAKVRSLPGLGLEWWLRSLTPICEEFARAARGRVDTEHWRRIYKWSPTERPYEPEFSTGWLLKLFPYLMEGKRASRRNPLLGDESSQGVQTSDLPGGMSRVPLTWRDGVETRDLVLCAGLAGVKQEGSALKPTVNWAVTERGRD